MWASRFPRANLVLDEKTSSHGIALRVVVAEVLADKDHPHGSDVRDVRLDNIPRSY
jgi:hypothetical protein